MRVSYSAGYVAPLPDGHIFSIKIFSELHEYLLTRGTIDNNDVVEPTLVDFINLNLVHTPIYSNGLWSGELSKEEIRKLGPPWSKKLVVRSRLAVQGTINASIIALRMEAGITTPRYAWRR